MKKYILPLAVALGTLAFVGCSDDNDYAPGMASEGVYFPADTETDYKVLDTAKEVKVSVSRTNADEVLSTPVEMKATTVETVVEGDKQIDKYVDASSLFSVPASVSFAAGAKTADMPITFDASKLVPEKDYTVTLTLGGDTYEYVPNVINVHILVTMWGEAAQGIFQNDLLAVFGMQPGAYYVQMQKYLGNAKKVRILNPFLNTSSVPAAFRLTDERPTYITIDYTDPEAIYMERSALGNLDINPYVGEYVMSLFAFYQYRQGITVEQGKANGLFTATMKGRVISFPKGELLIQLNDGESSGLYDTGSNGMTKVQLPESFM